jgi:hypothetical protein
MTNFTDRTSVRTALFVKMEIAEYKETPFSSFSNKTLLFSDHYRDFELFPGENYTALGQLMTVTSTVRELTPSSSTVNIQISGIPQASLNQITESKIKSSPVTVWRGFFDVDGAPITQLDRDQVATTRIGNSVLSTDSRLFNTPTGLSIPDRNSGLVTGNINNGKEDFTYECWIRPRDSATLEESYIFDARINSVIPRPVLLIKDGKVSAGFGSSNAPITIQAESPVINLNQWYHVAFVRKFQEYKLFVNGIQRGEAFKLNQAVLRTDLGNAPVHIGLAFGLGEDDTRKAFVGDIDELRISNVSRYWLSNFSLPTGPFLNDLETLLQLRFDGDNGSINFLDDNTPVFATKTVGKFKGFVNNVIYQEDWDVERRISTLTVNFDCSSTVDLLSKKRGGRKTNPASMKRHFPNDVSFDRVPALVNANINFGGTQ